MPRQSNIFLDAPQFVLELVLFYFHHYVKEGGQKFCVSTISRMDRDDVSDIHVFLYKRQLKTSQPESFITNMLDSGIKIFMIF